MSITSSEVNYLVYRYLTESGKLKKHILPLSHTHTHTRFYFFSFSFLGYNHTAFTFFYESEVDKTIPAIQHSDVPLGMLVSVLQKGLQYNMIETHIQPDGTYKPCGAPFSLLTPHRCASPPLGTAATAATFTLASPTLQHQHHHHTQQHQQQPPQLMTPTMGSAGGSSSPRGLQLQSPPMNPQPSSPLAGPSGKPSKGGSEGSTLSPKSSRSKLSISTIVSGDDSTAMDVEEAAPAGHFDLRQRGTREPQGRESFRPVTGASLRAASSRFSPSGDLFYTLSADSASVRLSAASAAAAGSDEKELSQGVAAGSVAAVAAWRGDGRALAVGYSDGACRVWDASGRLVRELRGCHPGRVTALKWSPRGTRLCTVGHDSNASNNNGNDNSNNSNNNGNDNDLFSVGIWDTTSWACLARYSKAGVTDVAWQSEAALAFAAAQTLYYCALSGDADASANASAPRALATTLHTKRVNALAWWNTSSATSSQSVTPALLASASADSTVRITAPDIPQGAASSPSSPSRALLQHSGEVLDVRWLPSSSSSSSTSGDVRRVVTLTKEGVALWEVGRDREAKVREWRCAEASEMRVAHGGRFVAVAAAVKAGGTLGTSGTSGGVAVWDVESGEVVRTFVGMEGVCHDLSWSRDDDLLLVTCGGRSCILDLKK